MRPAIVSALSLAGLLVFGCGDERQPPAPAAAPASPGARAASDALDAEFAAAIATFRSGDYDGAYGQFVRAANDGDRRAARIAMVMHRFGNALFEREWDASDEELADWSALGGLQQRAEIEALGRIGGISPAAPPAADVLELSTFRPHRRSR